MAQKTLKSGGPDNKGPMLFRIFYIHYNEEETHEN